MNVYAWMLKQNPEATIKLLKGERIKLFDHVEVGLLLEGYYSLKDHVRFEFFYDGKEMGGFDQEMGGYVKWPWEKEPDPDLQAHSECDCAINDLFHLGQLADLKWSIEQRSAWRLHEFGEPENSQPERYHTDCIPKEHRGKSVEVLDAEATSPVAAEVHCDGCHKLIGWVNAKV